MTVAAEATDQTCYPLFVTGATGDLAPKTHLLWGFDALNGYMGLGTLTPINPLHVSSDTQGDGRFVTCNASTSSNFSICRSRGTEASKTIVADTDTVGSIWFSAYDGAAYRGAARIYAVISGTPGSADMPGKLIFATTADGANAPTDRMAIDQAGNVGIGCTAPDAKLRIESATTNALRLASGIGANYFDIGRQVEAGVPLGWLKFYGSQSGYGGYVFSSVDAGDYLYLHPSGVVTLGTADNSGTPATGKLVVQGSTRDGTTNIFVGRDVDGANVALLDTNGKLTLTGFGNAGIDTYIVLTRTGGYGSTYLQQSYTASGDYPYGLVITNPARVYMSLLENATGGVGVADRHIITFPNAYRVGIGTATPSSHLHITDNVNCELIMESAYTHADYCPQINLKKCRTSIAAPTIVASGDRTAIIGGMGYDGANYRYTGWMEFDVDGTPGSEDMPGRWLLKLTPDGANTPVEVLRATNAGYLGVGCTPGVRFEVQQTSDGSPIAKVTGANNPMWEVYSIYGSTSHRGAVQMVGTSSVMRVGTITDHPLYFSVHEHEVARLTTGLNFLIGTSDDDGTPATGRLVVQGATYDGSTNTFVARTSLGGNAAWLSTAGAWNCNGFALWGAGDSTSNGGMYSLYDDGVHIWVRMGAGYGCGNIIFTANIGVDHGHVAATSDPIVWIHSGTSPTGDNTEYLNLSHNRTNAYLDVGKGKLQVPTGVILGLDAATNTAGYIKMFAAGANAYYNTFTSGENTDNATYTLPLAPPTVNGQLMSCTTAGVLSWAVAPTKTIILPAASAALGTTTPATRETREIGTTARPVVDVLKFPHASIAFAWWKFILPDSYNGGTITAKISYTNIATDSTNKFLFTISAACLADGGPLDATMGTAVELEATVADTAEDVKIASWGTAITPSGSPAGGQVILIKLQRDPADTTHDTTSLDAYVLDLAIEYTTNAWTD
jgi:hypothetical protein